MEYYCISTYISSFYIINAKMKTETKNLLDKIELTVGGILVIALTYLLIYLVFLKQY